MTALTTLLTQIYEYLFSLIGIDFSDYSGRLPAEFVSLYQYVDKFFMLVVVIAFLYLAFNFLFFIFSLGGVRRK